MDKLVQELRNIINFKSTTTDGDIVLIVAEDPRFLVYALVTAIEPDKGRKKDWWNVHMQLLTVPPQEVTWTLREPQFTGMEIFTMDGAERFVAAVDFSTGKETPGHHRDESADQGGPAKKSNPFRIVK